MPRARRPSPSVSSRFRSSQGPFRVTAYWSSTPLAATAPRNDPPGPGPQVARPCTRPACPKAVSDCAPVTRASPVAASYVAFRFPQVPLAVRRGVRVPLRFTRCAGSVTPPNDSGPVCPVTRARRSPYPPATPRFRVCPCALTRPCARTSGYTRPDSAACAPAYVTRRSAFSGPPARVRVPVTAAPSAPAFTRAEPPCPARFRSSVPPRPSTFTRGRSAARFTRPVASQRSPSITPRAVSPAVVSVKRTPSSTLSTPWMSAPCTRAVVRYGA